MQRASLLALLAGTAVLYLWGLGASGWANEFYAAAVQAGTKSWKAFFFGSLDSSNAITVDKPPLSLWPMEISGRIFGFNSWSMLVPQALEGVASVWLLYATVKRWFGHWAGILAGGLLALTPVAVLMFRFNNPDAIMVLLMVAAAYCTTRAIETASTRWLAGTGALMGLSFLAKGLQPFTLLPALAIAYLVAAPTSLRRRLFQLLGAGAALIAGAGWWVLAVQLTPAADRPYIGGSGDNSALGLAFGYNGLSRLSGGSQSGQGTGFDGSTGIGRMFNALNGGQIAWLLPAALVATAALAIVSRRAARTDRSRAAAILWGGWLLVTGAVLSFAGGIIHTYYTVELAPAVAALVAIGVVQLWRARAEILARFALSAGAVLTATWSFALLRRTPSFHPWVGWLVLGAGIGTAILMLLPVLKRQLVAAAVVLGVITMTGGSAAYALNTAATPHTGSVPSAGPTVAGAGGFGGMGGGGMPGGGKSGGGMPGGGTSGGGMPGGGTSRGGNASGGGTFPGGSSSKGSSSNGSMPTMPGKGTFPGGSSSNGSSSGGSSTNGARGTMPSGGMPGGGGGGASVSSALTKLIASTDTKWAAATVGSQTAAALELATGKAVIAIGGFTGSDNAPTLAQFEKLVAEGKVRYFVSGGAGGGMGGGGGAASQITQWVQQHYTAKTVGSSTVYDLTKAKS